MSLEYLPGKLGRERQVTLLRALRAVMDEAPPLPAEFRELARDIARHAGMTLEPDLCILNYYGADGKMGLHQDKDEEDFDAPVLSVSLGDTAIFLAGGRSRRDPTRKFELKSGDVVVLGGQDRLAFHGIARVLAGTSDLLPEGGRLNLTLRRVTKPG